MHGFVDACPKDRLFADAGRATRHHGGVIDLHCHLLPGIDDGPPSTAEAVALAQALVAAGITRVVATPHVDPTYANTADGIQAARVALVAELGHRHIPLQVQSGAELDLLTAVALEPAELERLALGRAGALLVECPLSPLMPQFERLAGDLQDAGHRVLLAHPERSPVFHRDADLLRRLVARGAFASLTASSLVGRFGRTAAKYAKWALDEGLAHDVSTDAHDTRRRPPVLAEPLHAAGYAWLADWLVRDAPEAILDGRELPARPPRAARRTGWRLARRQALPAS
jgi:protein-tyrosine phosphatase